MTVTPLNEVFAATRKRANSHHLLVCIASAQHADTIAPRRTLHTNPLRWPLPRWAQWFYNAHAKSRHRPRRPLHPVYMTGASALLPFVRIASASFRTCSGSEAVSPPSTSMNGLVGNGCYMLYINLEVAFSYFLYQFATLPKHFPFQKCTFCVKSDFHLLAFVISSCVSSLYPSFSFCQARNQNWTQTQRKLTRKFI